jgi:hypothetical protein
VLLFLPSDCRVHLVGDRLGYWRKEPSDYSAAELEIWGNIWDHRFDGFYSSKFGDLQFFHSLHSNPSNFTFWCPRGPRPPGCFAKDRRKYFEIWTQVCHQ